MTYKTHRPNGKNHENKRHEKEIEKKNYLLFAERQVIENV